MDAFGMDALIAIGLPLEIQNIGGKNWNPIKRETGA